MSEAELAELFHAHSDSFVQVVLAFFSVTSAFLIAIHMSGRDLPRSLARVILALYSFTSLVVIGITERHLSVAQAVRDQLKELNVQWHPIVSEPPFVFPLLTYGAVFCMLAIFIASLWYFGHVRR